MIPFHRGNFTKKIRTSLKKIIKFIFTYGANVSICAGLKLWNTKKGNSTFVTVGYYMTAPEFKTDNMGDNGSWGIGFTTIINN